ncbi:type IV secretion protein Dot [Legionella sp. W05-934-2]|jgi:gas vesicle protein|uniref:type IV secretion protein Dot n=1 Tax=Legionella sp. W05-934-2 TaxID=1198649 RepID=UPI00346207A3
MSIFSTITDTISGYATGLKNKVVQVAGDFKKSSEDFIGDIVIKSAVSRIKEGALNALAPEQTVNDDIEPSAPTNDSQEGPNTSPNSKSKATPNAVPFGSAGLMQALMSQLGIDKNAVSKQLNGAIDNVTKDVSNAASEAVREKVKSIQPEDVMKGIGGLFGNAFQADAETGKASTSFTLDSFIQIIGAILAAIGMMMIISNTKQVAPKPKAIELQPIEESEAVSPSIH